MLMTLAACSGENASAGTGRRQNNADAPREPQGEPMPHEECVAAGGTIDAVDVNGDGQPDVRTVLEGGRAKCRETDANFDGRVDILRWFDLATGQVRRVEDDYDFDGRIDVVATYENGQPVRDILDTNFDGRTDTWRDYRNGRVVELRRDSDGDTRVDTWERFDSEGRLTYSGVDANHDGEPDPDPADGGARAPTAAPVEAPPPAAAAPAAPATPATPAAPAQKRSEVRR
jgi:hypothetical protein